MTAARPLFPPAALLLLLSLGCGGGDADGAPEPTPDLSARLRWAAAAPAAALPLATLPAEVLPAPDGLHRVGPGVEGRLLRWLVAPGDAVRAGQPLALIQSGALADRDARVSELRVHAEQAEARRAVATAEREAGVGTQASLAAATAEAAAAQAALRAARQGLRAAGALQPAEGGAFSWSAPADGTVGALSCAIGPLSPSDACVELWSAAATVVEVRVPERLLPALDAAGGAEGAFWPAGAEADAAPSTLALLSRDPALDRGSRQLRLRFAAPPGARAGLSGRLSLRVPAPPTAAAIPAAALTRLDGHDVVFIKTDPEAPPPEGAGPEIAGAPGVRALPVHRRGAEGGQVFVEGLAPGAEVAVHGVFLLKSLAASVDGEGH
jgi:cobalt-zinc-cadmium efflux system membrane fusion protein